MSKRKINESNSKSNKKKKIIHKRNNEIIGNDEIKKIINENLILMDNLNLNLFNINSHFLFIGPISNGKKSMIDNLCLDKKNVNYFEITNFDLNFDSVTKFKNSLEKMLIEIDEKKINIILIHCSLIFKKDVNPAFATIFCEFLTNLNFITKKILTFAIPNIFELNEGVLNYYRKIGGLYRSNDNTEDQLILMFKKLLSDFDILHIFEEKEEKFLNLIRYNAECASYKDIKDFLSKVCIKYGYDFEKKEFNSKNLTFKHLKNELIGDEIKYISIKQMEYKLYNEAIYNKIF